MPCQATPDRRAVLMGSAAAAAASLLPTTVLAAPSERPNILWLVSEDNNPFIGAYGDPLARTPNIDQLAREGVLFEKVYSNAPVCAPSRFGILTGVLPESCAPAQHMRAKATLPSVIQTYPALLRQAGYYCTNNDKTDYNCDIDPQAIWDDSSPQAHWRNRTDGKPFMAVFNTMTTHESRVFPTTAGAVTPDQVRVPAYLAQDSAAVRQDYASYYNLMEKMDGEIGARLAELDAAGLSDDTIVFYYSDNGGVMPRSKRYCYEEGLRCAMVVRFPPKWAHLAPTGAGGRVTEPVSFIDLAPTVLAMAGLSAPAVMQGRSLLSGEPSLVFGMRNRMDERYDFVRTVTDGRYRYIRNYNPHRPVIQNQAFAWLMKSYQDLDRRRIDGRLTPEEARMFEPRPFEELYDLDRDPDEVTNLARSADHAAHLQRLSTALDAHMMAIVDNGFIPEGDQAEGWMASRTPGVYPLDRIMPLAQAAGRRDADGLGQFSEALSDANSVVRYWGAMGMLILGDKAAPERDSLRRIALSDPSPQVKIVAAEAICGLGDGAAGCEVLSSLLDAAQPLPVRLQAINALTYAGPSAALVTPQIRQAAADGNGFLRNAATYLLQMLDGSYQPEKPIFDLAAMRARSAA